LYGAISNINYINIIIASIIIIITIIIIIIGMRNENIYLLTCVLLSNSLIEV